MKICVKQLFAYSVSFVLPHNIQNTDAITDADKDISNKYLKRISMDLYSEEVTLTHLR